MAQRTTTVIFNKLAAISAFCAALMIISMGCGPYRTVKSYDKDFAVEIPSNWTVRSGYGEDLFAIGKSDTADLMDSPRISIDLGLKPQTSEALAKELKVFRDLLAEGMSRYPECEVGPITTIRFGEFTGSTYSEIRHDERFASPGKYDVARFGTHFDFGVTRTLPPAQCPLYKRTYIYFHTPRGPCHVYFEALVSTYEKHLPEFEFALNTFRLIKK